MLFKWIVRAPTKKMSRRFVGGDRLQRGRGIGGILRIASRLFSPFAKVVKSALKSDTGRKIGNAVKEQAVESSINLVSDIAKGRNVKESLRDELENVKRNTKRKAVEIGLDELKKISKKAVKNDGKKSTPKKSKTKKLKKDIFS